VPGGGGDEAVEQVRGLDLVAPTEALDNALNMSPSLADILDEVCSEKASRSQRPNFGAALR
jgi:hypothetical protein